VQIPLIAYAELTSNVIPIGAGLLRGKYLGRGPIALLVYVTYSLFNELAMLSLALHGINNLWLLHICTLVEFLFMVLIFAWFTEFRFSKKAGVWIAAGYAIVWALSKFTIESFDAFDNYTSPVANFILVLIALKALHQCSQSVDGEVWRRPFFWFSLAVLIKFAGDFSLFLFGDWFVGLNLSEGISVWSIHWTLNILSNIGFGLSLLCLPQTTAPTGSS
jgi:hypothetical protein